MFRKLIATSDDYGAFLIRVVLGLVMLPHGMQKVFGWFGGYGFNATLGFFSSKLGIPTPLGVLVILAESLGALALILGLLGRFSAFGVAATMLGAVAMVHGHNGFFMNWNGNQPGEGFEYHLLALAMAAAVMIRGSGALSLDRLIQRRLGREESRGLDVAPRPAVAA
jgi:putative oxidoreductase